MKPIKSIELARTYRSQDYKLWRNFLELSDDTAESSKDKLKLF